VLHFRTVRIARYQDEGIIIETGLRDGEMVVFSSLKDATDGMIVRTVIEKD